MTTEANVESADDTATQAQIRAIQEGDREAFAQLVGQHYALMLRVALRVTGNSRDAEDVTQQACIKLGRSINTFRFESTFSTWLYRLVINCAHDWRKSQARHQHDTHEQDIPEPGAELSPDSGIRLRQVMKAIEELGQSFADTVVLVIGEGLTHREAADALNVKESTISWRLHEIRKRLSEY
ncbi:MAG: RNA polymerase sigma factor (sigma-70 family) [Candidatus Azotimanducaceae bacterium]|jgi:RNA polymerase sigma factor (sigma-70 family)